MGSSRTYGPLLGSLLQGCPAIFGTSTATPTRELPVWLMTASTMTPTSDKSQQSVRVRGTLGDLDPLDRLPFFKRANRGLKNGPL